MLKKSLLLYLATIISLSVPSWAMMGGDEKDSCENSAPIPKPNSPNLEERNSLKSSHSIFHRSSIPAVFPTLAQTTVKDLNQEVNEKNKELSHFSDVLKAIEKNNVLAAQLAFNQIPQNYKRSPFGQELWQRIEEMEAQLFSKLTPLPEEEKDSGLNNPPLSSTTPFQDTSLSHDDGSKQQKEETLANGNDKEDESTYPLPAPA